MPLRSLFHQWHRFSFIPPQLKWLYASSMLLGIANALLFLVGPVFLFQLGSNHIWNQAINNWIPFLELSTRQTGLLTVAIYYVSNRIFHVLFVALTANWLPKISLNVTMILGTAGYFLSAIMLPMLPMHPWLIIVIPLVRSSIFHWYWGPYYILLASEIDIKKAGSEMGGLEIISKIATLLGPLIGAVLSINMGYSGVFWIGAGFYFLAMFSLFNLSNMKIRTIWRWSDWWEAIRSKLGRQQITGMAGFQWESVGAAIIWPIFLYIFLDNLVEVGYIITGATMISMLFVYLTGWIFDHSKNKKRWSVSTGSILMGLWGLRIIAIQVPMLAVAVESLDKIFSGMYRTVFSSLLILRARANNAVVYSINRQVTQSLINIVGWVFFIALVLSSFPDIIIFITFLMAMIASMQYVRDERLRYRK